MMQQQQPLLLQQQQQEQGQPMQQQQEQQTTNHKPKAAHARPPGGLEEVKPSFRELGLEWSTTLSYAGLVCAGCAPGVRLVSPASCMASPACHRSWGTCMHTRGTCTHTQTRLHARVYSRTHAYAQRQGNPSPPSLPSFLLVWYVLLQSSLKSIVTSTPGARELLLQQVRATLGALRMCF